MVVKVLFAAFRPAPTIRRPETRDRKIATAYWNMALLDRWAQ
jgi:hypothetical protein